MPQFTEYWRKKSDEERFFQASKHEFPCFRSNSHPSVHNQSTLQLIYHHQPTPTVYPPPVADRPQGAVPARRIRPVSLRYADAPRREMARRTARAREEMGLNRAAAGASGVRPPGA